jgi:hypothetical protein
MWASGWHPKLHGHGRPGFIVVKVRPMDWPVRCSPKAAAEGSIELSKCLHLRALLCKMTFHT